MNTSEKVKLFNEIASLGQAYNVSRGSALEKSLIPLFIKKFGYRFVDCRGLSQDKVLEMLGGTEFLILYYIKIIMSDENFQKSGRKTPKIQVDFAIVTDNLVHLLDSKGNGINNNVTPQGEAIKFQSIKKDLETLFMNSNINKEVKFSFLRNYKDEDEKKKQQHTIVKFLSDSGFETYSTSNYFEMSSKEFSDYFDSFQLEVIIEQTKKRGWDFEKMIRSKI